MSEKFRVECLAWKPFERNTLRGFATIRICALRLTIEGVTIHEKNGSRWAQLPARPQLDTDRNLIREPSGKVRCTKILSFDDRRVADAFSAAVVKAVEDRAFRRTFTNEVAS